MFRSQRFTAISNAVFGIALLVLSVFELSRGRREAYVYGTLAFAFLWFCTSWLAWRRAKKYV